MNKDETKTVLAIAAGFDNRRPDDLVTAAWLEALNGYTFEACRAAVIDHFTDPATRHQYLTVGHVLDRVEVTGRARSTDVEADVRSAKARRLIDQSWPKREPLPDDVAIRLSLARQRERDQASEYGEITA